MDVPVPFSPVLEDLTVPTAAGASRARRAHALPTRIRGFSMGLKTFGLRPMSTGSSESTWSGCAHERLARGEEAAGGVGAGRAAVLRHEQHPLPDGNAHRHVGDRQAPRASRCCRRATSRSCGTSAPPPATTSCTAPGSVKRSRPGISTLRGALGPEVGQAQDVARKVRIELASWRRRSSRSKRAADVAFALARALRAGQTVSTCGWCMLPLPLAAETLARDGFSAVVLDAQHGLWDTAGLIAGTGALAHGGATPVVRVPLNDFALVWRALDFGAEGIIAPMINKRRRCPPPRRRRQVSRRPANAAGALHRARGRGPVVNRSITCARRTTARSLSDDRNADRAQTWTSDRRHDSASIALFIGPYDLSIALSRRGRQAVSAPEVERALRQICAAAVKANKIPGPIVVTPSARWRWPSAASNSSRCGMIWPSCAPASRRR